VQGNAIVENQPNGAAAKSQLIVLPERMEDLDIFHPDWEHWLAVGGYDAEELALLSLDLDPRSHGVFDEGLVGLMNTLQQINVPNRHRIRDRLRVIQGRIGDRAIRLAPFLALARELAWEVPPNLQWAAIEERSDQGMSTKERKSLLKIIVALAAEAGVAMDTPSASAVVIVNKAKALGHSITEGTVEKFLKEARDLSKTPIG
jgi:hypothetical protein